MPTSQARRRQGACLIASAALMLTVAGCALPLFSESSITRPTSSGGAQHGAPILTQPELSSAQFASAPCQLLTETHLLELGIAVPGREEDSPLGKNCRWIATDTPAKVDLSLVFNTQLGGLDQLYARKRLFPVWEPLQIAGYPAVYADDADEFHGYCGMNVAISGTVLVAVGLQLKSGETKPPDFADPCPRAAKALAQVVAALRNPR